ncbi:peptidase C39, partial [Campylobacter upsaliensis]|nr:peptidase C39 [Campylobacter upsaliensis]
MEKILKIVLVMTLLPLFLKAEFVVKSYQEIKNEKVIRQNYEESCGAASLATL